IGETAEKASFNWVMYLRKSGLWVEMDYSSRGLKSQMKKAGRLGARKVLIVGEDELTSGKGILRDMATRKQEEVQIEDIVNNLGQRT
ncbi:MAG: histidine--tRNA ligase, partial [Desulfobacteraceae bacterium 4484_190.1]